jgi:competence protein ComFC
MESQRSFLAIIKNSWQYFLDLIFPKQCLDCGIEGSYLCISCFKKIKLNDKNYCVFCKKELLNFDQCENCFNLGLKKVFVATDYNQPVIQDLLHNLKYNYTEEIGSILAEILQKIIKENNLNTKLGFDRKNVILMPIPLHKKRYLQRGFNQTKLIADHLHKELLVPVKQLLIRNKNTETQVKMNRQERLVNLKNAFEIINEQEVDKQKNIILIDDVVTTGSTLSECALVLQRNGYKNIYGLVVAQRDI